MSIEILLLILVVVVLPLIEMFRTAQQKRQQPRAEAPQEPPMPVRRSPVPGNQTQAPPEWMRLPDVAPEGPAPRDVPVLAEPGSDRLAARETMSDKIAARRRSIRREAAADLLLKGRAPRETGTIPGVVAGLRSPGGLQRAMVVMAILGPCRAVGTPNE